MAVTLSKKADRVSLQQGNKAPSHLKWWLKGMLGLLVVSLFLLLGSHRALTARLERSMGENPLPPTLLRDLQTPDLLKPVLLALFPPGGDLELAANSLTRFVQSGEGPARFVSLNTLRGAKVTADEIRKTPDAPEYALALERLQRDAVQAKKPLPTELSTVTSRQFNTLRQGLAVRSEDDVRSQLWRSNLLFLLGLWIPLLTWRIKKLRPDPWLLPLAGGLSSLGFTLMVSLRDPLRDALLFPDFAVGVLGGGIILAAVSLYDLQASPLRHLSFVPLLGALLTSLILLVFGVGPGLSDARVNLHLGPIVLQPVEVMKIFVVLFLAGYCARRWEFLRSLTQKSSGPSAASPLVQWVGRKLELPRMTDLLPLLVGMALSVIFLFLQKDMGPALVLGWTFLALYSLARNRGGLALLGLLILFGGCFVGYQLQTPSTVYRRIDMLLHPWDTLRAGADQLAMGLWAVAAGGWGGAGLGWGETARVPAAHTDFILAAVAEELGWVGIMLTLVLYGLLFWRLWRVARQLEDPYACFLVLGFTSLLMGQLFLIGSGVLGILPLSGVTTPLLSYGKSSQWCVFLILGGVASLSGYAALHGSPQQDPVIPCDAASAPTALPFLSGMRVLAGVGLGLLGILGARAADLQLRQADAIMLRPLLALQAEDEVGYVPNPRLRAIADRVPRGTLLDRNGLPLATNQSGLLDSLHETLGKLGVNPDDTCPDRTRRCYPFGGLTFHMLGDLREQVNWAASNTDFAERKYNVHLQGFDDKPEIVEVKRPDGRTSRELKRDYSALLPVWWVHQSPDAPEYKALMEKERDLTLSLDMKMQVALAKALEESLAAARADLKVNDVTRASAVILDAQTGAVLASVTTPRPVRLGSALRLYDPDDAALFDRPRFAVYAPGSTFKLVTAMAAVRKDPALITTPYKCQLLPDGRAGILLPGKRRPIRDDIKDKPHGNISMRYGIQVSCNAYFAQLATQGVQAQALFETSKLFGIRTSRADTVKGLEKVLDQVGFGQGEVVASPFQIATVAATIANGGRLVKPLLLLEDETRERLIVEGRKDDDARQGELSAGDRVLTAAHAQLLADAMRDVVSLGTARRSLGKLQIPVAGKTGTAEVEGKRSHAWFMGFAPYLEAGAAPIPGLERPIAFAVVIENAGYGGRYAAPVIEKTLTTLLGTPSPAEPKSGVK